MSWPYAYSPYIWPMFGSAVISVVLAVYGWKHRAAPGAAAFAVVMLCDALWAVFTGIEVAATTESAKVLWFKAEAMAAVVAMTALLSSAIGYAYPGRQAARRIQWTLAAVILVVLIGVPTNDLHHLYWTRIWFDGFLRFERGLLNPPMLVYILLLPTSASLIFLRLALRSRGIYRGQALLMFTGSALPPLTSLLRAAAINPVAPLDPLVLIMNVSGLFYMLAVSRFGMLSVVPLARDSVIERMADGLLVLDAEGRVLDLNPAVRQTLGLARITVGHPVAQALAAYPQLARLIEKETDAESEITLDSPAAARCLRVNIATLTHAHGHKLGRRILFQDVTERKKARELAQEQQRALAALQERERLAGELHDSLSQELAFINVQAQATHELLRGGDTQRADEYVLKLAAIARQAQVDARDLVSGLMTFVSPEAGFLPSLRRFLDEFCRTYGIETEVNVGDEQNLPALAPTVQVQLLRIIQEALTNIRKHAQAQHARLRIKSGAERVEVVIEDDGVGFAPSESANESGHFGLRIMRERAASIGGVLDFHSEPGKGTRVVVRFPVGGG